MTHCNARIKCKQADLAASSSSALFEDLHNLQGILTHPLALKEHKANIDEPMTSDDDENSDGDHSEDDTSDNSDDDSATNSDNECMYFVIHTDVFLLSFSLLFFYSS